MAAETRQERAGRANGARRMPETCPDTRALLEADMERTIREGVELLGGRVFSVRDSRGLAVADMPDLLCIVPGRDNPHGLVALLELKSQRRIVTPGQHHVLNLLMLCDRLEAGVVRPIPKPGELSFDDALELLGIRT